MPADHGSALRRGAFSALRALDRSFRALASVATYAAAGTLTLADLRRGIERRWEAFGAVRSWDAVPLMPWEKYFYAVFLAPEDRILVVGSGTGRDLLALLERGHRVEGLEPVRACVETAREHLRSRGLTAPLYVDAIESATLDGGYDAFVFSWFCYGYIPGAARRIQALRNAKAHLNPGGRILISYLPRDRAAPALVVGIARVVARVGRSDWSPEPGDVVELGAAGDWIEYEHRFRPGELADEARAAGLTVRFHSVAKIGTAVLIGER